MPNSSSSQFAASDPVSLVYEADLLGNIQQALAGLQGYGVMALELIQNADDAGAVSLSFDVTDDGLFVRNDASFSTCGLSDPRCPWDREGDPNGIHRSCNFHAISRMGSRNKIHVASQIGRFGIGFVSVYQITDNPIVRSAGFEMRLDPVLGQSVTSAVSTEYGTEFELPWASMSSDTRKALNASPTPGDVVKLVADAIEGMLARGLFFLRNLERVELCENGRQISSVAIARIDDVITLHIEPGHRNEKWKLLSRKADDLAEQRNIYEEFPTLVDLDRSSQVTIAIPLHASQSDGLLYAYLPTEQASGLPLHINGDFFPHPTRRTITLTGEQHERYWNELLLDTAAKAIAENFDLLRELLGFERLWALANAIYAIRDKPSFQSFWLETQISAKTSLSVRTVDDRWCIPAECHLPDLDAEGQAAIAAIGLNLLHEQLRAYWNVLSALGAAPLRLRALVAALETISAAGKLTPDLVHLRPLWRAVDAMMTATRAGPDLTAQLAKLKAVAFLLDFDGDLASLQQMWRTEDGVRPEDIRAYVPDCPLVHGDVLALPALRDAIDVYSFDDLARDLATEIADEDGAVRVIGQEPGDAGRFYALLTAFKIGPDAARTAAALASVPILKTGTGFISASRGRLPGGFVDPIGHFELIDTAEMPEKMQRLARDILSVDVLTFDDYVKDHLEEILRGEPSREQYVALLAAILDHRTQLDNEGTLQSLAHIAFVRTRAGSYARPSQCYYWSAQLETLLGTAGAHWVDEAWMPPGSSGARFQDLLENRLNMRRTPAIPHLVDRIQEIAESQNIDAIARDTQPIVRHILDRFPRLNVEEREALEQLRTLPWLPGSLNGERVQGKRFAPSLVYRSFRAPGFLSQRMVVDLPILRGTQGGRSLIEFLDFLQLPEVPPTEDVVAHLEHCMAENLPASDVVYAILSERLGAEDAGCIDRLEGEAFIYDAELKCFLKADRVFWNPTYFRGRWHLASSRMRGREPLYRRLGVTDTPTAHHHAALLLEIASQAAPAPDDVFVHEHCLAWLADALDRDDRDVPPVLEALQDKPALLNLLGEPVWHDEAAWRDSVALAQPFAGEIDARLVAPPPGARHATARLFRELGVSRLSEIARLSLAAQPESTANPAATARLRERAPLLLWLAPNSPFRARLHDMLGRIVVHMAPQLQVHAEIIEYDPPVRSPSIAALAFYDAESGILYVKGDASDVDWPAAFHALFAPLEQLSHGTDMKPVTMTAAYVVSIPSTADAERALRQSDYHPPDSEFDELPLTDSIADAEEEAEAAPEPEEDAAPETDAADGDRREDDADDAAPSDDVVPGNENETEEQGDAQAGGQRGGGGEPTPGSDGDPFGSKADSGGFGTGPGEQGDIGSSGTGGTPGRSADGNRRPGPTRGERQQRRSRMLTYVNAQARESGGEGDSSGHDLAIQVDIAAIAAVLKYEARLGRNAVEQAHNNPGYDIVSSGSDSSERRLIEVKGLEGEWTERGVKLSRVQYATAQQYGADYWIYVVEHARDLQNNQVYAIANPFSKVEEYWFDHGWRDVIDETATANDMNLEVGAKLRHAVWGLGTIQEVKRHGAGINLLIDFGDEGRKLIPFNANLEFVG